MRHSGVAVALALASIWAVFAATHRTASAQTYPDRSVRIIIAFPAGGTIDTLGRIVAQKLSEAWGQSVFVENRPRRQRQYRRRRGRAGAAGRLYAPPRRAGARG